MEKVDLFFIVLSAVIFGGGLVAFSAVSLVRYSKAEDAGGNPMFRDLFFVLMALAFVFYGGWRAGLFG